MKKALIGILAVLCMVIVPKTNATERYVVPGDTPGANPVSPYISWETAATNVNDIEAVLANGDRIVLSNGVHLLKTTMTMTTPNVQYVGLTGNPADVIISGGGAFPCCYIAGGTNQLVESLTVSNGYRATGGYGAGFMVYGAPDLTLSNCVITKNVSQEGCAGITVGGGSPGFRMIDCTVSDNWGATNYYNGIGGGLSCGDGMTAINCVFSGNTNSGASAYGGGVYVGGGSSASIFYSCSFSDNYAGGTGYGGGGYNVGPVRLIDCWFGTNTATVGGGWTIANTDTLITNSDFVGNKASYGGGVGYDAGNAGTVKNCRFYGNSASSYGGAVSFYYGKGGLIDNCVISNNSAAAGGGVNNYPGGGVLRDCLIIDNSSLSSGGGGVWVYSAWSTHEVVILSCTIASNTTTGPGGAIHISGYNKAVVSVTNSILYFNKSDSEATKDLSLATSYSFDYCCTPSSVPGANNITTDPLFVDAASGNYRLTKTSPCRDTGLNQDWMSSATDLEGNARIYNTTVDMGCYEYTVKGSGTLLIVN